MELRADFIFDIRLMNTYGVILRGYTEFDYYQADSWRVEDGTVTLIKMGHRSRSSRSRIFSESLI